MKLAFGGSSHPAIRRALCLGIVIGAGALNGPAGAQTRPPVRSPQAAAPTDSPTDAGCPGGNGIRISVTSGDSAVDLSPILDLSRAVDTTIVFNIANRSWTRTNLAAAISVGLADEARGGYRICAGITALMPSATLTIRGARGRLHFQASLAELTNAIRTAPGATSPQPRRL